MDGAKKVVDNIPEGIAGLSYIVDRLRGDGGCPWDRKQTPKSMTVYMVEELYELIDAILEGDSGEICEELGDLLFHILFIESIFRQQGKFDIKDVARVCSEKMVRRHPHVFGDKEARTVDEVKNRWHRIKQREKKQNNEPEKSVIDSVPKSLPALVRAYRIGERAARVGFDWREQAGVMKKVKEELKELEDAVSSGNEKEIADEMGDLLFSIVNLARFLRIHPETALSDAVKKFEKRFRYMEKQLAAQNRRVEDADDQELDSLWERSKDAVTFDSQ